MSGGNFREKGLGSNGRNWCMALPAHVAIPIRRDTPEGHKPQLQEWPQHVPGLLE